MEERFKFRHVHAITGTFVLVALGVLIAAIVFAGRSQRWFIGNVPLRILFPEGGAAGIRQGSEVYFLGTLMGSVFDVSVDPAGSMEAHVNIRSDFFRFLRTDSSAVVKRKFGGVGDAYFEITRGDGPSLSEKKAVIVCKEQVPGALETAVDEIRREAVPALKKLNTGLDTWAALGTKLDTTRDRLDKLIDRVDSLAAGLQRGEGTVGRLLTDSSAAEQLDTLLVKTNGAVDELQIAIRRFEAVGSNLELAAADLPAISEALGKEAEDLPGLVLQTQISMRELERLIEAMQRHWLLRKYVDKTNPPPLRSLPAEAERQKFLESPRASRSWKRHAP